MNIEINKELVEKIGVKHLSPMGVPDSAEWSGARVDLARLSPAQLTKLQTLLTPHSKQNLKGARVAMRDLLVWREALDGKVTQVKCKTSKQFASLLFAHLKTVPGQRCYTKHDSDERWRAYYCTEIEWHPRHTERGGGVIPAHTTVEFAQRVLTQIEKRSLSFYDKDVRNLNVVEILASESFLCETEELRSAYLQEQAHYKTLFGKIGLQCLATGYARDDIDGNGPAKVDEDDRYRYRWRGATTFQMDRDGEPSKVVVDIVKETEGKDETSRNDNLDGAFWRKKSLGGPADNDDEIEDPEVDEDALPRDDDEGGSVEPAHGVGGVEIPVLPVVPIFDLRRQMRMTTHAANLTVYKYDDKLADKLVLNKDQRDLIHILLHSRVEFRDVVKGKGNGAVILCSGPPGVGKTLTAEVFAESEGRPLFSVQASQLGLDPETLEAELTRAFARAQRWNAIMLLDESDVYVSKRGSDLKQNAVVGVFLRVLEYYQGVLFLTTNRSDLVDDAIASRCVARLDYQLPSAEEQINIWRILADSSGVKIDAGIFTDIAAKHRFSGRDVKQLLKLGYMVARARKKTVVTADIIEFVRRFKPTQEND